MSETSLPLQDTAHSAGYDVGHDGGIAINFAEISDIGGRQSNQDALATAMQDDLLCFVIADGAGGHEGGELASKVVVNAVIESFLKENAFGPRAMRSYIDVAIAAVASAKQDQPNLKDMSATVAAVLIDPNNRRAIWAHMGDTRIYLFRRSKVHLITKDHSMAQQFVDAGFWPYDNIRTHPQRNRLFAAIGAEGETVPEVSAEAMILQDGDVFLGCTDGVWEWIDESAMEHSLEESVSAQEWLQKMRSLIQEKAEGATKSRDNCSAFAIWIGEPEVVTITR